ncbi:type II secretion system secretin GspD [Oceanospirillum linum]|uniref:Type II secretion system protein GspD n=1 Tax=Oceanospirillum linum TaxID=966 RepID=A0A1T1HCS1_OCELI|nr:type II secretion system secretin GspD [Oceanospirillum linum]OOV87635.1 type II secretion system protein GspD [Oceanospirillum linum]SEF94627.1 general secretion pathway protein D [Oleiphilus messinensis]SMP11812.1 general secretion pathway protein D [Oceanospirillum linum]
MFKKIILISVLIFSLPVSAGQWKVNIKDAEIDAFISQIADFTGKSFIVDPRVKGRVTVISKASMDDEAVYQLFLSVLNVHGFVAVETDDGAIKIIPNATSKQEGNRSAIRTGDSFLTEVIQLKSATVSEVVPVLRPLVPQYGHLAGVQSSNALIISDHGANIERLKRIISRIDAGKDEQIEVISLQHAWVGDLATLIEELESAQSGSKAKNQDGRFTIVADERSNRLILKGSDPDRQRIKNLIAKLDKPFESKGVTQVIQLNYAEAVKVAELLDKVINDTSSSSEKAPMTVTKAQFQADESLNALVIRAEPMVMSEVKSLVSQLDIRRSQVLIEAVIVEVSGSNGEQLGVQWLVGDFENGPVGGTSFGNAGVSGASLISDAVTTGGAATIGKVSGAFLGGSGSVDGQDLGLLVQALATTSNANLLSTPSVMTLDNEEAEFVVGQNVPFLTGTTTSSTTTNPFTTISREDVGVTLKVKPQINDDDSVRLEVLQEVSSLVASDNPLATGSADRITNKRSIDTTILVSDGETIVLGGLIQDDIQESVSKVPLLGDIPLIGALFRSTQITKTKRNLLVFLRPKIIRDSNRLKAIADAKYQGIYRVGAYNGELQDRHGGDAGQSAQGSVEQLFEGGKD